MPPLGPAQIEQFYPESKCCYWPRDLKLESGEFRLDVGVPDTCENGSWPNANYSGCEIPDTETLRTGNPYAVLAILLAVIGLILVGAVLAFSLRHIEHKVIKNSSRELSLFTLIGAVIAHFNIFFVFFATPSAGMCGFIRFTSTLGYTFILSSLFLKTNRLFRIYYSQFSGFR